MVITQFAQVDDEGVQLVVTCQDQDGNVIDISAATTLTIKLGYPDGTTVDKTASLYSDGTDGKMVYVTGASDLSQPGLYSIQGKIGFTVGPVVTSGRLSPLQVFPNVDDE